MDNLEIKVPKEIRDYRETLVMGLTARQTLWGGAAIAACVGSRFLLAPALGTEIASWVGIIIAIPAGAIGFIKYHGMTAERAAVAIFKSMFCGAGERRFKCENYWRELVSATQKDLSRRRTRKAKEKGVINDEIA